MRLHHILPSVFIVAALSGCSVFEPETYNCSANVTSYQDGVRSSLITQNTKQNVEVRLNGVSAICEDRANDVATEVAIGLKVSRELEDSREVAPVIVPMVAAVISADETVLETQSFVYTMQFTANSPVIYPLVRRDFAVPKGGRVILSLTPEVLGGE